MKGIGAVAIPITPNLATRIRIEIPDDLESRYRDATNAADVEKAQAAWQQGSPLVRHPVIIVPGMEPLSAN